MRDPNVLISEINIMIIIKKDEHNIYDKLASS